MANSSDRSNNIKGMACKASQFEAQTDRMQSSLVFDHKTRSNSGKVVNLS